MGRFFALYLLTISQTNQFTNQFFIMDNLNKLSLAQMLTAPTPSIFRKIRNGGLILAAISTGIIGLESQGVIMPSFIEVLAATGTTIAGLIAALVSQVGVDFKALDAKNKPKN